MVAVMKLTRGADPAITFDDVTLGYERHPAVHHVTGVVPRGELLALVGPNGAGKSTLLKGIMGELKPLAGSIDLHDLSQRQIADLPQQIDIDRSFPTSVFDSPPWVCGAKLAHSAGSTQNERPSFSRRLLPSVSKTRSSPDWLPLRRSVPEDVFARLLLQDASLILLDEPFRAIDEKTIADMIALIERWHAQGRTKIAALHDFRQVRASFPANLIMAREVVAWGETKKVLTRKTSPNRASSPRPGTRRPRSARGTSRNRSEKRHDPSTD